MSVSSLGITIDNIHMAQDIPTQIIGTLTKRNLFNNYNITTLIYYNTNSLPKGNSHGYISMQS